MKYLKDKDIDRQDCVDSACYELIEKFCPEGVEVEWNIENIGLIRDALKEVLVDNMGLMTEMEFYPYVEWEEGDLPPSKPEKPEKLPFEPDNKLITITDEQLVTALKEAIDNLDADELAMFAGDMLGGLCWYNNDETYTFETTECYLGAFDSLEEKKDAKN